MTNGSPRVLVVEDHPDSLATLVEGLELRGYRVRGVESGRAAIAAVREAPYDVVVTDLQLPDLSGLEVLTLVKELSPETEVIVLTGQATLESAVEALRGRAFDFLLKPLAQMRTLQVVIDRAVSQRARPARREPERAVLVTELSEGEREVLALVARGLENKAIARELGLSERAVRNHLSGIFGKLGVGNRTKAALWAQELGLI